MKCRLLFVTFLSAWLLASGVEAQVVSVDGVVMKVSDMDRAVKFYTEVLPFQKISDVRVKDVAVGALEGVNASEIRNVRLVLGDESIELIQFVANPGHAIPSDARSNDLAFQHIAIVVSDMDKAYARLREHRVEHVSSWPQTLPEWNKGAAGIRAFYFHDPDKHNLEIIFFPPGKGDPKWQRKADAVFLGIDHTAIVVRDTRKSLEFYRDLLGLRVAGNSENYGPEQEHLNGVFGAHLEITGLRAESGPGIEFLEYLVPTDGREKSGDVRANDLVDTETVVHVHDSKQFEKNIRQRGTPIVSTSRSSISQLRIVDGFVLRDPDGHAIRATQ